MITIAPELQGAFEVIHKLKQKSIITSIGHTECTLKIVGLYLIHYVLKWYPNFFEIHDTQWYHLSGHDKIRMPLEHI